MHSLVLDESFNFQDNALILLPTYVVTRQCSAEGEISVISFRICLLHYGLQTLDAVP